MRSAAVRRISAILRQYVEVLGGGGRIRAVMAEIAKLGFLHTDCLTVTGKTVGENIAGAKIKNEEIIHTIERPVSKEGGIAVLKGNLAPEGSVVQRRACDRNDAS